MTNSDVIAPAVHHADQAYEAVRSLNHTTLAAKLPAPVVYDVLGNLKGVGHMLPQALQQLVRRAVGRWVNDTYRRRPMIIPVVVEV